jgi:hypothetical protein
MAGTEPINIPLAQFVFIAQLVFYFDKSHEFFLVYDSIAANQAEIFVLLYQNWEHPFSPLSIILRIPLSNHAIKLFTLALRLFLLIEIYIEYD